MTNREEVLTAFSMEEALTPKTLKSYLARYPLLAEDLLDLYNELVLADLEAEEAALPLETKSAAAAAARIAAVEAALSGKGLRALADRLSLPRAFLMGFQSAVVRIGSIPSGFLKTLARAIGVTTQDVIAGLQKIGVTSQAYAFKADGKPDAANQMDFGDYVASAGLNKDEMAALERMTRPHGSD